MTTLISLIGKSKADPQTGYRKAHYSFEPGFSRTVSFFGLALLDYAKPERLILAGTAGSMWDVFFEHQQTDDETALALMDAVEKEAGGFLKSISGMFKSKDDSDEKGGCSF